MLKQDRRDFISRLDIGTWKMKGVFLVLLCCLIYGGWWAMDRYNPEPLRPEGNFEDWPSDTQSAYHEWAQKDLQRRLLMIPLSSIIVFLTYSLLQTKGYYCLGKDMCLVVLTKDGSPGCAWYPDPCMRIKHLPNDGAWIPPIRLFDRSNQLIFDKGWFDERYPPEKYVLFFCGAQRRSVELKLSFAINKPRRVTTPINELIFKVEYEALGSADKLFTLIQQPGITGPGVSHEEIGDVAEDAITRALTNESNSFGMDLRENGREQMVNTLKRVLPGALAAVGMKFLKASLETPKAKHSILETAEEDAYFAYDDIDRVP